MTRACIEKVSITQYQCGFILSWFEGAKETIICVYIQSAMQLKPLVDSSHLLVVDDMEILLLLALLSLCRGREVEER